MSYCRIRKGMSKKIILIIVFAGLFIFGGSVIFLGKKDDTTKLIYEEKPSSQSESLQEATDDEYYYIFVCGCVENPGVYKLTPGSRIFDAIEMAGGVRNDADITVINQAERISDGQKIYIPQYGEQKADTEDNDSGLININLADIDKLMTLPGIGESKAKAIINYRNENGKYNRIEDIMNISGIKDSAFNKIKDYICVG